METDEHNERRGCELLDRPRGGNICDVTLTLSQAVCGVRPLRFPLVGILVRVAR